MSYPPSTLAPRTDASPAVPLAHAQDHTDERNAINDIVSELGANPSGDEATVQARLEVNELAATADQAALAAHLASSQAHIAAAIAVAPFGSIVSTSLQDALEELEAAKQDASAELAALAAIVPSNDDVIQRKSGSWVKRTIAQLKADFNITKSDVGLSNVPNTDATARANHTGTQTASTISDFSTAADARITAQRGAANGIASLDSSSKVPLAQLPISGSQYQGTWNANTNTPTLANGTGTPGDFYSVATAGTTNFGAGGIAFAVGDQVAYNGTIWQRIPASSAISSVFGRTGDVVAGSGDYNAGQITNTPAGTIASSTVQGAINELDSEKQPVDADLTAIAGLDSSTAGTIATDGSGWVKKTYSQLKTALGLTKTDVGLSNVPNTDATARANHTGTQIASTISDFNSAADARILASTIWGAIATNYGATGDGVTDDTSALNSFRDAAGIGNYRYVPRGTYIVSGTSGLNLNVADQIWEFHPEAVIKAADLQVKPLNITAARVKVFYGKFDGACTNRVTDPCVVRTTGDISLNGEQTINGVATSSSRVLVYAQTNGKENGIWVSGSGAWARASDADSTGELHRLCVPVTGGTVGSKTMYVQTISNPVIGTDTITFAAGVPGCRIDKNCTDVKVIESTFQNTGSNGVLNNAGNGVRLINVNFIDTGNTAYLSDTSSSQAGATNTEGQILNGCYVNRLGFNYKTLLGGGLKVNADETTLPATGQTLSADGSTNTFTYSTSHGLSNNAPAVLVSMTNVTSGLTLQKTYYIVGATGTTFQLAESPGGSAVDFATSGSASVSITAVLLSNRRGKIVNCDVVLPYLSDTPSGNNECLVVKEASRGFVVANNTTQGGTMGVSISGAYSNTVVGNTFNGYSKQGVEVAGGPSNTVTGNTIDGMADSATYDGTNYITPQYGVVVWNEAGTGHDGQRAVVAANTIRGLPHSSSCRAIHFSDNTAGTSLWFVCALNDVFVGGGCYGININNGMKYFSITGNMIDGTEGTLGGRAISVGGGKNGTISGNCITSFTHGVYLDSSSIAITDVTISANAVLDCTNSWSTTGTAGSRVSWRSNVGDAKAYRDVLDMGANIVDYMGTSAPSLAAGIGSLYRRTDGTPGKTLYIKQANTDNTGWDRIRIPIVFSVGNSGTSKTLNFTNGEYQSLTLTGNCTVSFTGQATGFMERLVVAFTQDGTGSRTLAFSGVKWPAATAPTVTSTAGATDLIEFISDGSVVYGKVIGQAYA